MNWLGSNAIALVALAISMITASIQVATWHSARHKVTVLARSSTAGVPGQGGTTLNHSFVTLTIRNTGRAISVDHVDFTKVDGTIPEQGVSWSNPPDAVYPHIGYEPLPSVFRSGVLLADGESRSWVFSLHVQPYERKPLNKEELVAIAELSNGKKVKSEPFWHSQSPVGGWGASEFDA